MVSPKSHLLQGVGIFLILILFQSLSRALCIPPFQTPIALDQEVPSVCMDALYPASMLITKSGRTIPGLINEVAGNAVFDSICVTMIVPGAISKVYVFSPNSDNKIDYFSKSGRSTLVDISYLQIGDRWSNQIFKREHRTPVCEQERWDGRFREEPMQPGVFAIGLLPIQEDLSKQLTGNITLIS